MIHQSLNHIHQNFPLKLLKVCLKFKAYPKHFPITYKQKIKSELEVFYADSDFHQLNIGTLILRIKQLNMKDVFFYVYKLLKLAITVPFTSASVERSFSGLKRIETYLRNSMTQQRLNSLSSMSINKDVLCESQAEDNFYDIIIDKYCKLNNRKIDLNKKFLKF